MKSKLFSLIVSVLAAMCLWVYVMTVVNPDVDLTIGNIPVTFSGAEVLREDHGLVITGDYQEFVSVHFYYGKNADLKTLDQHKDEIKAVIDVSKVRSTKDYTMSYDITLPSAVSASSITKMDKSPANITFTVERQIRKPSKCGAISPASRSLRAICSTAPALILIPLPLRGPGVGRQYRRSRCNHH